MAKNTRYTNMRRKKNEWQNKATVEEQRAEFNGTNPEMPRDAFDFPDEIISEEDRKKYIKKNS